MKNTVLFVAVSVIIFFPSYVIPQDNIFYEKESDIVKALSQPVLSKPGIKTRSLTRGLPRDDASQSIGKKRTLVVIESKGEQAVFTTVTIPEGDNAPRVNLKIEFAYNSCELRPTAYQLLRELGNALNNPALVGKQISVLGHTDSDGSDQYNLSLSLKRATSVKNYLVSHFDLSPSRINVFGYGEAESLLPNSSSYNKQVNRRVEIRAE